MAASILHHFLSYVCTYVRACVYEVSFVKSYVRTYLNSLLLRHIAMIVNALKY